MRTIERTSQFKRDYKRESRGRHRTYLDASLALIVEALANDQPLEPWHHNHALSGEWGDHHDCHVKPGADLPEVRRRHPAPGTPRITCRTRFIARRSSRSGTGGAGRAALRALYSHSGLPPPLVVVGVGGTKNGLPMRFSAPRILRLAPSLPHGLRNGGAPCIDQGLKQRRAAAAPPDALYGPERGRGDSRHPLLRRLPHPRGADHLVEEVLAEVDRAVP